jgi:hypothetical protein
MCFGLNPVLHNPYSFKLIPVFTVKYRGKAVILFVQKEILSYFCNPKE